MNGFPKRCSPSWEFQCWRQSAKRQQIKGFLISVYYLHWGLLPRKSDNFWHKWKITSNKHQQTVLVFSLFYYLIIVKNTCLIIKNETRCFIFGTAVWFAKKENVKHWLVCLLLCWTYGLIINTRLWRFGFLYITQFYWGKKYM